MVAVGIIKNNTPYVQLIHSFGQFKAPPRDEDEHHGKYIAAVVDRAGNVDSYFFIIDEDNKKWQNVNLPTSCEEESPVAKFFEDEDVRHTNRREFCPAANITWNGEKTWIPIMPMVPAEVGYKIAKRQTTGGTTAWELLLLLVEYINGRSTAVVNLVQPAMKYAAYAATVEKRSPN